MKRFWSALLALVLFCCPLARAAQPAFAAQAQVGQRRADGTYPISYRCDLEVSDLEHDFYYSEQLFDHPAQQYDHALATLTLGMTMAASNSRASDGQYWLDGEAGRGRHLDQAFRTLGFGNIRLYHYDESLNHPARHAAYGIAQKTLTGADGKTTTLVAVMVRGAGYGGEWANNFEVNAGAAHTGFVDSAGELFTTVRQYLDEAAARGDLGELKLWAGGFSRGGALANLLAARLAHEVPELAVENTFVYTFAAPAALTAQASAGWMLDYDNNHTAAGSLKPDWDASNVFNLISSGDVVPRAMPEAWGYHRNGNDRYLPAVRDDAELRRLKALSEAAGLTDLDFGHLGTSEDTDSLVRTLLAVCTTQEMFVEKYQDALMDMMQCAMTRSEAEVAQGAILNDREVIERLLSLEHMDQIPWWTMVRNVWLASSMSRPLLEKWGANLPLQAQQVLVPLLAVGLCYNLETDVLQVLAQYIVSLFPVRGRVDQAVQVILCHYPETYLVLMEAYDPSAHGREPYTIR